MNTLSFLKPIGHFQYSVNLSYDLNDENKIKSYIPTASALSLIEEIVLSTLPNSTTRARLLTGAYGKGKSHLTLTLTALLSGKNQKLFKNILNKAKVIDSNLYGNIESYINSRKKLLPIIVNGISMDLKSMLLYALNDALKQHDLLNIMPATFFDVAISKIKSWEKQFADTYKAFEQLVGCSGDEFIVDLASYNQATYNLFVKVYPSLTAGSEFNPMEGSDVIKVYSDVAEKIKKYGYEGLFLVYDEFGKFLEGSVEAGSAMDIKLLQDLAEKANRSGSNQIHLLFVSHKGIDNYVGKLSKEKIDSWKAVSERFTKISLQSKDSEIFDMISQILKKDKTSFERFIEANRNEFDNLERQLALSADGKIKNAASGIFSEIYETVGEKFVYECYPLHPYSLYMLPRISEMVAQNERTIFTYLASTDKNSVSYFARRCEKPFPIIEPDQIYDYFEPLFRGEPFGSEIRKHWQIASAAIAKLNSYDNDLAIKIVKTLSLIYMISQFEVLPPSLDLIYDIYSAYSFADITAAIECVKSAQLLIELQFKPHVRLKQSSGNNINELIANETIRVEKTFNKKAILTECLSKTYYYPVEYNDSYEITRYFKFMFIEFNELMAIGDIEKFTSQVDADGLILGIVVDDEAERVSAKEKIEELGGNRVVYILPKDIRTISSHLLKIEAINSLLLKCSADVLLTEELNYVKEDLLELTNDYVETLYLKPEHKKSQYYYNGKEENIVRKSNLTALLSTICKNVYYKTPRIVNENINKNTLSTPMKNTRKKILDGILNDELKPNLSLVGSQDINVLRSVYVVPGIIPDLNNPHVTVAGLDNSYDSLLKAIKEFVVSSAIVQKSFSELYDILIKPEYGYGLKKGVIPFYIALVFREFKKHVVIKNKSVEISVSSEVISSINDHPEAYTVKIENWDETKELYMSRLERTFFTYVNESDKAYSTFDYIAKAIQRWFFRLSKFDRESKNAYDIKVGKVVLSKEELLVKNALKAPELNAREFLFDKLPKIYRTENYLTIAQKLSASKMKVDNNSSSLILLVANELKKELGAGKNVSLSSALKDFYESLSDKAKTHVYNGVENNLINYIKNPANDDLSCVKSIIRAIFSLRIEDFTDVLAETLIDKIVATFRAISDFNNLSTTDEEQTGFVITYRDSENNEIVRNFDNKELSPQAKLLYNTLTSEIDEFGEAVSPAERWQILVKILMES